MLITQSEHQEAGWILPAIVCTQYIMGADPHTCHSGASIRQKVGYDSDLHGSA